MFKLGIFCRHDWNVDKWRWAFSSTGDDPLFLEAEQVCRKCGRRKYWYPPRDTWKEFKTRYKELEVYK